MESKIITVAEVIDIAFSDVAYIEPLTISDADVAVATSRWIAPVVGEALLGAVAAGRYAELRDEYLKPAIALHTRLVVQPRMNACAGQLGLSVVAATTQRAADEELRKEYMRALRERAKASLRRLSDYLDDHADEVTEYDAKCNILKRCRCDGGFVQVL